MFLYKGSRENMSPTSAVVAPAANQLALRPQQQQQQGAAASEDRPLSSSAPAKYFDDKGGDSNKPPQQPPVTAAPSGAGSGPSELWASKKVHPEPVGGGQVVVVASGSQTCVIA